MKEGWQNDEYLTLFESREEAIQFTQRYGIDERLPGYFVIGLRGWDDFILSDAVSHHFTIPTVPAIKDKLQPYTFPQEGASLKVDPQYTGKIKWYITPIIFGGSPTDRENLIWVTFDQHIEAVRWWNAKYDEIKKPQT